MMEIKNRNLKPISDVVLKILKKETKKRQPDKRYLMGRLLQYHSELEKRREKDFIKYLIENLELIIKGSPIELANIISQINKQHQSVSQNAAIKEKVKKLFSWENFRKNNTAVIKKFLEATEVDVCPYCNRNYIATIKSKSNKILVRATIDHFFCIKYYPFLSLSVYNWIPSCSSCNSFLKRDKKLFLKKFIHPFIEGFEDSLTFTLIPNSRGLLNSSNPSDYKISLICSNGDSKKSKKARRNADLFKLERIYNVSHKQDAINIYQKCRLYNNPSYQSSLSHILNSPQNISVSIYNLLFNNYFNETDMLNKPLSKFTKDIALKWIDSEIAKHFL